MQCMARGLAAFGWWLAFSARPDKRRLGVQPDCTGWQPILQTRRMMNDSSHTSARPGSPSPFFDVRMRGFRARTEVHDVVALLADRLSPLPAEAIDLPEAAGRVLAQDVIAEIAVPAFDRAAMDGYALRAQETYGAGAYNPLELEIIGEAFPGRPFLRLVGPGQAVRIMTGAPVPDGADAVLQAEAAEEISGRLRVSEPVAPGRHIGRRGEDIEPGTAVLATGRVLRPQDLGVLASLGNARPLVTRRPTAAIITTGDELLPCGTQPSGYRIVDSNSVMLQALTQRDGGLLQRQALVRDTHATVKAALADAHEDVILVSGGSSVGQEDHAPRALAEIGELCVHGVALRPASPTGIGFVNQRPVFLLPGNPVSCLCAYDFFAGPALRRLGGRGMDWPYRTSKLQLARKVVSAVGRVDYMRVRVRAGLVEPLATSGAAILSSTTHADGFLIVARDSEGYAAGDQVEVLFYDR
jgi:molybdopterin molybdotransferase